MTTALNNHSTRSRHTPVPLRAIHAPVVQKRKLLKVHHIHTVNRLLAACAAGFLPVASYILAHIESHSQSWLWVLVLAALAYSAPTLASWAASWTHKGQGWSTQERTKDGAFPRCEGEGNGRHHG